VIDPCLFYTLRRRTAKNLRGRPITSYRLSLWDGRC